MNTRKSDSTSLMAAVMGDSRRMFANHFLAKADAYFHGGYYPSIFDQNRHSCSKLSGDDDEHEHEHDEEDEHQHDHTCFHGHGGDPDHEHHGLGHFFAHVSEKLDRFGRHFYPSEHRHLGGGGSEREILPWLKITAELDPHKTEIYPLAAYWLGQRLGRFDEALEFLRHGLRANPDSCEILLEIGRIFAEHRSDSERARNVWTAALEKWQAQDEAGKEPDPLVRRQILGLLAKLEGREGNFAPAISYLEQLREMSHHPDAIQEQIDDLKAQALSSADAALSGAAPKRD